MDDEDDLVTRWPYLGAVTMNDLVADGPSGTVPMRWYAPPSRLRAGFVWIHGGAFIGGTLDGLEAHWVALELAARGIGVLTVSYRKAKGEVCYPVPNDDVHAGWGWAVEHADELGVPGGFQLGGASAGGALAAALTVRLRDADAVVPRSLLLAYALVHPELPPLSPALRQFAADGLSSGSVHDVNLNYAGSSQAMADPHAFAGLADLTGMPPTYLLNSEFDVLRASGERFARQLATAGVPVTVEYEPGAKHGHLSTPDVAEAGRSIDRIDAWITAHG